VRRRSGNLEGVQHVISPHTTTESWVWRRAHNSLFASPSRSL
jgi:hypothetical protein